MARTRSFSTKRRPDSLSPVLLLAASLLLAPAASAAPERTEELRKGLAAPGTLRSVFFIGGMSCRACTLIIDRHLNEREGVHWARFNYPLRLFTVYHDPARAGVAAIERMIAATGELRARLLESEPAAGQAPGRAGAVASWKGGSMSRPEAEAAPVPFAATLADNMIDEGSEEWNQVVYEIAGEAVRNRILRAAAAGDGYHPPAGKVDLPAVIAKDFYWPVERLAPTPEEAAVALFVREKVILGDEGKEGRERFDDWLLGVWKDLRLDFRGEILELER